MIEVLPRELLLEIFPVLQLRSLSSRWKILCESEFAHLKSCCRYSTEDIQELVTTGDHVIAMIQYHETDITSGDSDEDDNLDCLAFELSVVNNGHVSALYSAGEAVDEENIWLDETPNSQGFVSTSLVVDIVTNTRYLISRGIHHTTADYLARRTVIKYAECLSETMEMIWFGCNADCITRTPRVGITFKLWNLIDSEGSYIRDSNIKELVSESRKICFG